MDMNDNSHLFAVEDDDDDELFFMYVLELQIVYKHNASFRFY
jgi:hypothetical protein